MCESSRTLGNSLKNLFPELEEAEIVKMIFLSNCSFYYHFLLFSPVTMIALSFSSVIKGYYSYYFYLDKRIDYSCSQLSYYIFMQTRESFGSLCRTSLCDRIRHLYYRLRSGGSLTYTGVSTSSSIGSSHQFSNGTHSQVPIFLGGISVVVCFMAAVVSLAFALAIVPRQVMPWTGLLLMYEWIITLFILFFGGYLHLIYLWGKTTATQAGSLSSNPEAFDYDSGKVTAAASTFVAGTSTVTPGPEEAGGGEAGGTGVGGIGKGKGDPEEKAALLN
ncbi:putative glucuronosyltransferase PGSIP6 [Morella rubra]|uniref:Putative glucuronosyltransferase PGSIP6 n=1 Tax=Morella rubra TaxID=262757 RepID=A0A6A1UQ86_9ROSI|nr:putative glucuronosyltransferase PGSIP6 [Morella rubra]